MLSVNWQNRLARKAVRRDKDVVPSNGIYRHRAMQSVCYSCGHSMDPWTMYIGHVVTRLALDAAFTSTRCVFILHYLIRRVHHYSVVL